MLTLRPVTQLLLALKPRRHFASFISRAVLSKEGGTKCSYRISGPRASGGAESAPVLRLATNTSSISHGGQKRGVVRGRLFPSHMSHITFTYRKGRTVLVFSLFLLCNSEQVFQRLIPHSSVTEGGPRCLAIGTIYPGDT